MMELFAKEVLLAILVFFFIFWGWQTIKFFINMKEQAAAHVAKIKKLDDQKCQGPHNWVKIFIIDNERHVCKDCCWCPDMEDYIKRPYLESELRTIEYREGLKKYRKEMMQEIADEYLLDIDVLNDINDKIKSIKKNYAIKYIEKNLKEGEKLQ